jgi:tetrapyrrole methylase family protein/MazG family protein
MLRLVRLSEEHLSEGLLDKLRQSRRVFHAVPEDVSFGALIASGVACLPVPAVIPSDAEWLILPSPIVPKSPVAVEELARLVWITDRLLGPGGCPWDQAQTHESLKRHLLEEAYEVLDAIDSGSREKLKEELGDLLLQPIMHAQMEALAGSFDIGEVAKTINEKLIRRHPHVFGDLEAEDADEVLRNWDRIKQAEKGGGQPSSILEGVPKGMASLLRAYEVSKRAARSGFEWPDIEAVFEKLQEEETELREALEEGSTERIESEVGDLLFTAVNVARWAKVEPEEALRKMLNRFTERFMAMEATSTKPLSELSVEEWDELWEVAKSSNRSR